jgi:glycosyltransferase involved in cell wall biosynthesis
MSRQSLDRKCGKFLQNTSNNPVLTIITVVFNGSETLERTITSVVNQTYKNLEYIIIDGGSTDGTQNIIRKYQHLIDYWVSEPDHGIYDAMNKALCRSRGNWVYFLGCDDAILSIDVMSEIFASYSLDFIEKFDIIIGEGLCQGKRHRNSFDYRMLKGNSFNHQCAFYKRSLFDENLYDTSYSLGADYKFNLKLYLSKTKCLRVSVLISEYGGYGVSSRNFELRRLESNRARIESCGHIAGMSLNILRAIIDSTRFVINYFKVMFISTTP